MKTKKYTKLYEWQQKAKERGKCPLCNSFGVLTVDHIIPVSLLEQLGMFDEALSWEQNFQLICQTCNKFKGGRIDMRNPKSKILLKEIINKI